MKAGAAALCLSLWCLSGASAQSYQNSPHVEGDSASVRVYYDQRVNTTNVKKDVFIYNGPKADEVLAAVRRIVSEQRAELATLVKRDDVDTLRSDLLRQLNDHFDSQPDVIASLRTLLDARAPEHLGYWDVSVGLSTALAGGPGMGGTGRVGGSLDMLTLGAFRQSLALRLGFEVLKRSSANRHPDGRELREPDDRLSFHGWIEPGYEARWLGRHVSVHLGFLLGAQTIEAPIGAGPFVTYGITLAPEVHLGPEDRTGVRLGVQWRVASMTRPVFELQGRLGPSQTPERNLQHMLLVYAGMYFGLFS